MLKLTISAKELYNDRDECFIDLPSVTVSFEHSLFSLSKWESKYKKPFLTANPKYEKTDAELRDYLSMMCLQELDPNILRYMNQEETDTISEYMNDKQTATWFDGAMPTKTSSGEITSELIYYWLITFRIPFEVQYWHINRLLTLVDVCNVKNAGEENQVPLADTIAERDRLNEERLKMYTENG